MEVQNLQVACVVDPQRPGRIAAGTRRFVNWETFYLCDAAAVARFDADPARYCEVLTDPVSKRRFRPGPEAPRASFGGREWFFPSDSSRVAFAAAPDSFSVPMLAMVPGEAPETAAP